MTPYYNTIAALHQAQIQTLQAIDTEGVFSCLYTGCCGVTDTQVFTNLFIVQGILQQYQLTGALPDWDNICCPVVCGDLEGGTTVLSPTGVTVSTAAGVESDGRFYYGSGTLAAGTLVISAPWVTAGTIINATYTTASAAGQANISRGTIIPGTSFAINGEGTNTFNWTALVP